MFGYGGKQVRDNIHSADLVAAFDAFAQRRARRRSTTSAAGARATARCSRRSAVRGDRGPQARLDLLRREPHRRPPLVGLRPVGVRARPSRTGRCATRSRTSCARSTTRTWSTGRRREPLGRHPGPQRGGGRRADAARPDRAARAGGASTTRSSSSTTPRRDGTADVVAGVTAEEPRVRCVRNERAQRLRLRGPHGARDVPRRRRRDRDGRRLRRPARRRPLLPRARGRLRLRVRLALHARRAWCATTRASSC